MRKLRRRWHRWLCRHDRHQVRATWGIVDDGDHLINLLACRWCHELECSISARLARHYLETKKTRRAAN